MDLDLTVENERLAELLTTLRFENRQQSGLASDLVPGDTDAAYRISRMRPTEKETFSREMRLLNDDLNRLLKQIDENEIEILIIGDNISENYLKQITPKIEKKINRKVSFFVSNSTLKQKTLTIFES